MANAASHAPLPYIIRGARYSYLIPYLDASGTPTDPVTPDTEYSLDDSAPADCAEEVGTLRNSVGLHTLTGAETNGSLVSVAAKSASGPKTTLLIARIAHLAVVGTGTLSAGSAGGGTLGTLLAYDVTGCFIKTTGGTGGGGTGGANNQARKIVTYNTGSGAFTVSPNWETTPSTDTTYEVLLPEGVTLGMLKALNPTTAGNTLDVTSTGEAGIDWGNVGNKTTTNNLSGTTTATTAATIAVAVRDVDNTAPAANSLGATVSAASGNAGEASENALNALNNTVTLLTRVPSTVHTASQQTADLSSILSAIGNVPGLVWAAGTRTLTSISQLAGITSLANWLRALGRKGNNDATAVGEINANNGTGVGTYDPTTDSQEAQKDNPPSVSVNAQDVADALKLAPTAGTPAAGSVYAELDEIQSTIASAGGTVGSGADQCTLNFKIGGTPIPDADVWITTDSAGDVPFAGTLQTDSSGNVTFLLDAGNTYYAWLQKDGVNPIRGQSFTAVAD